MLWFGLSLGVWLGLGNSFLARVRSDPKPPDRRHGGRGGTTVMLLHLPLYHLHPRGLLEYKCIHVCKSKGELNKWASVAIVAQAPWPGGRRHIYVYIYIYIQRERERDIYVYTKYRAKCVYSFIHSVLVCLVHPSCLALLFCFYMQWLMQ